MRDPRCKTLAHNLLTYSCALQPGEKVLIDSIGRADNLGLELIEQSYELGAMPFVHIEDPVWEAALLKKAPEEYFTTTRRWEEMRMSAMDAYIGVRSGDNIFTGKAVPPEQNDLHARLLWKPVHGDIRVPKTKWVILRYPTDSMAQQAAMATEDFEDLYFSVCNLDYSAMSAAMDPLVDLMNKTEQVRITAPRTDLRFSIAGMPAIKCDGTRNIPDGEVYTAPVRDSVNGVIHYNAPSPYNGFTFTDVELTFAEGRIVKATANDSARANKIFDTDEGARYVGEFALGVNPAIKEAMGDTLFDEKIAGSLHFTPGSCYEDCWNGNVSAVHWDLVLCMTPAYGGGEIWFDDVLIHKDGLFVLAELKALNP